MEPGRPQGLGRRPGPGRLAQPRLLRAGAAHGLRGLDVLEHPGGADEGSRLSLHPGPAVHPDQHRGAVGRDPAHSQFLPGVPGRWAQHGGGDHRPADRAGPGRGHRPAGPAHQLHHLRGPGHPVRHRRRQLRLQHGQHSRLLPQETGRHGPGPQRRPGQPGGERHAAGDPGRLWPVPVRDAGRRPAHHRRREGPLYPEWRPGLGAGAGAALSAGVVLHGQPAGPG